MSSTSSLEPTCSNAITVTETNSDQVHDTEPDSDQSHEPISQEGNSKQQVASSSTKNVKPTLSIFHYLRISTRSFFLIFITVTLKRAGIAKFANRLLKVFLVEHPLQTKLVTLVQSW